MVTIVPDGRHWCVFNGGDLVAKTVYRKGAQSVRNLCEELNVLRSELAARPQVVAVVHPDDDSKATPVPIIW